MDLSVMDSCVLDSAALSCVAVGAWLQEARVELEAVRLKAPRESTVYIALGRVCKTLVRACHGCTIIFESCLA
jgi:hypothetical protein